MTGALIGGRRLFLALYLTALVIPVCVSFVYGCGDRGSSGSRELGSSQKLRWAPPVLSNPQTINVKASGFQTFDLTAGQDYIVNMPDQKVVGTVALTGGRNIVLVGGHISSNTTTTDSDNWETRNIYVKGQTGVVHIEGVLIDGSGGGQADGVDIYAPQAVVQLQNMRIVGLHGHSDQVHADVVQPFGSARQLRIDRLTGSSNYQGLQLAEEGIRVPLHSIIQNVNLSYQPSDVVPNEAWPHLLWLTQGTDTCKHDPTVLSEVYIVPRPGQVLGQAVWPPSDGTLPCRGTMNEAGDRVSWPDLARVSGSVKLGSPPGGDFVPAGVAGTGYVSPGYASRPERGLLPGPRETSILEPRESGS
jgi:hypothetical protein